MAFQWYESEVPDAVRQRGAARNAAMYLDEARQRAGLLRRLGYTEAQALARISKTLEWGFEVLPRPAFLDQIATVVGEVYKR